VAPELGKHIPVEGRRPVGADRQRFGVHPAVLPRLNQINNPVRDDL